MDDRNVARPLTSARAGRTMTTLRAIFVISILVGLLLTLIVHELAPQRATPAYVYFRLPASKYGEPVQGTIVPWGGGLGVVTPRGDTLQFRNAAWPGSVAFEPDSACAVYQDGNIADSLSLLIGVNGELLTQVTFVRFGQVQQMAAPLALPKGERFHVVQAMRLRMPCMFDLLDVNFVVDAEDGRRARS